MGPTSETGSGPPTSCLKKTDTDNKKAKPVLCQSQIIQQLYTFSSLPHACCVHIQLTMKCMVCATVTSSWASFVMLVSKISELKTKWPFALVKTSPSFFAKQVYSLFYWSAATSLPFLLTLQYLMRKYDKVFGSLKLGDWLVAIVHRNSKTIVMVRLKLHNILFLVLFCNSNGQFDDSRR